MSDNPRISSPAALRNREPILAVLRRHLPPTGLLLEIASGGGEHAVHFAAGLPGWTVQPTDPTPEARASIAAWAAEAALPNLRPPLALDVRAAPWPVARADAVLCVNMVHIAPWSATPALMAGAALCLPPGAPLLLYGPFRRGGAHTAPGNAAFDESLRQRDPRWGVRDLEAVTDEAVAAGFHPGAVEEMPANNLVVLFRRAG
ncbi:SAM-dependent methyltransferase [Pseudoroseomonas rhizosphaerae]|uniref:SAM-dependent methyltransferase n=1 Tax=Teichococcus rhizosphaerae TaxID=1335062 RepID=A0A2C7ACE1_9PROT|nr:DUF938 domain-containing protein [Pseudoroseomonas rhizosphaerae]PHK95333.1 SAM-dependent methyltransferase [Pseudoroseomonas rhizosphaerae]